MTAEIHQLPKPAPVPPKSENRLYAAYVELEAARQGIPAVAITRQGLDLHMARSDVTLDEIRGFYGDRAEAIFEHIDACRQRVAAKHAAL